MNDMLQCSIYLVYMHRGFRDFWNRQAVLAPRKSRRITCPQELLRERGRTT